jgi:hypothetical protein
MSFEALKEVVPVQVNLENDELIVIETLQYGAYDAMNVTPGAGASSNCNCNSNCNGSSEDPIG